MLDIDKEIAEKVMGWHLRNDWWVRDGNGDQKYIITLPVRFVMQEDSKESTLEQDPWRPSTNIEQAFMVMDRMRALDWQMQLFSLRKPYKNFFCAFYYSWSLWKELKTKDYCNADTPAMAICLAALKLAKSVELVP